MIAYATKDQMKVWKMARKEDKDEITPVPASFIHFEIKDAIGSLSAANYGVVKRNIKVEDGSLDIAIDIPRRSIEIAEKAMSTGDRAYFYKNSIKIANVAEDPNTGEETLDVRAEFPFVALSQTSLDLKDPRDPGALVAGEGIPDGTLTVDAKRLKEVLDQFKLGSNAVWIHIKADKLESGTQILRLSAFEHDEEIAIRSAVIALTE